MAAEKKLIALRRITYSNQQYIPGDELPTDTPFLEEWLNGNVAKWQTEPTKVQTKAKPASAQAGVEGINVVNAETEETVIGKVPVTEARKRSTKSAPRKKARE